MMQREDKDKIDINERMKIYGKMSSTWECSGCKHEMTSFLYNWEYHIPYHCPECGDYEMIENETKRVAPFRAQFFDKSREMNFFNSLSPAKQAAILSDDSKSGGYY